VWLFWRLRRQNNHTFPDFLRKYDYKNKNLQFWKTDCATGLMIVPNGTNVNYQEYGIGRADKLLQILAKSIIVNHEGVVIDYDLNSPFMYLLSIKDNIGISTQRGSDQVLYRPHNRTATNAVTGTSNRPGANRE